MVPPKLKLVQAMVLLPLRLTEHPLVTVPPPRKLDPLEPTQGLEPPALTEDTKSPPPRRHYHQVQQDARHSTAVAGTLAPLPSHHLLSYRRGETNINSIKRQHIFIVKHRRFSREDSSDSGGRYATRKRDDSDSFVSGICNDYVNMICQSLFIRCFP